MALTVGIRLDTYEILAPLGAGGMGVERETRSMSQLDWTISLGRK